MTKNVQQGTKKDNRRLITYSFLESMPLGIVLVAASEEGLCYVRFGKLTKEAMIRKLEKAFPEAKLIASSAGISMYLDSLERYFRGDLRTFDLPLDLRGIHSPFQKKVYNTIIRIPFGEVITYGELARKIGSPKAYRAVGNALGRNRIPVVIPCHRVVAANGGLGGFTGGVEYKKILLKLEGIL